MHTKYAQYCADAADRDTLRLWSSREGMRAQCLCFFVHVAFSRHFAGCVLVCLSKRALVMIRLSAVSWFQSSIAAPILICSKTHSHTFDSPPTITAPPHHLNQTRMQAATCTWPRSWARDRRCSSCSRVFRRVGRRSRICSANCPPCSRDSTRSPARPYGAPNNHLIFRVGVLPVFWGFGRPGHLCLWLDFAPLPALGP
jgi:hypothetical protein